eukprot:569554-Pyramimonas_sp.AAC.1
MVTYNNGRHAHAAATSDAQYIDCLPALRRRSGAAMLREVPMHRLAPHTYATLQIDVPSQVRAESLVHDIYAQRNVTDSRGRIVAHDTGGATLSG